MKFAVRPGAEQADEQFLFLNGDRQRSCDHIRRITAYDQIDLIDFEQFRVQRRNIRWVALIVVVNRLDGTAKQPALGVHIVLPDFHAGQCGFAVRGELTGLRDTKADRNRFSRRCRDRPHAGKRGTDNHEEAVAPHGRHASWTSLRSVRSAHRRPGIPLPEARAVCARCWCRAPSRPSCSWRAGGPSLRAPCHSPRI